MADGRDLIFMSSQGGLAFRFANVVGWQTLNHQKDELRRHSDPTLAKKGEMEPTGKVILTTSLRLYITMTPPLELTPEVSAEFLQFVKEKVDPDIWRSKEQGKPDVAVIDKGVKGGDA